MILDTNRSRSSEEIESSLGTGVVEEQDLGKQDSAEQEADYQDRALGADVISACIDSSDPYSAERDLAKLSQSTPPLTKQEEAAVPGDSQIDAAEDPRDAKIIDAAEELYDAGLNVFPTIRGDKQPYDSWKVLNTTRLLKSDLAHLIKDSNIAVLTGRTSENLFVINCDTEEDFQQFGEDIKKLGLRPWIRLGARGGQYWMRSQDGEVKNAKVKNTITESTDILGHGKYTLAPPSIHPTGVVIEWAGKEGDLPSVTSQQLNALGLSLRTYATSSAASQAGLPPKAAQVLVDGDPTGHKNDHQAEFAACLSLIGAGWSDAKIMETFGAYNPPHYAKVGETKFQKYILTKAHERHQPLSRENQRSDLTASHFLKQAAQRRWRGRTGSVDHSVYRALCDRYEKEKKDVFRASCREVAELAVVTSGTASKALKRLTEQGLIERKGTDAGSKSTCFRLLEMKLPEEEATSFLHEDPQDENNTLKPLVLSNSVSITHTSHDAWAAGALGKSAKSCYLMLTESAPASGLTVADLVKFTGKSRKVICVALNKLKQHGLVQDQGGQWQSLPTSDEHLDERLTRIAKTLGKDGIGARRTAKHKIERQQQAGDSIARAKNIWHAKHTER